MSSPLALGEHAGVGVAVASSTARTFTAAPTNRLAAPFVEATA